MLGYGWVGTGGGSIVRIWRVKYGLDWDRVKVWVLMDLYDFFF